MTLLAFQRALVQAHIYTHTVTSLWDSLRSGIVSQTHIYGHTKTQNSRSQSTILSSLTFRLYILTFTDVFLLSSLIMHASI